MTSIAGQYVEKLTVYSVHVSDKSQGLQYDQERIVQSNSALDEP